MRATICTLAGLLTLVGAHVVRAQPSMEQRFGETHLVASTEVDLVVEWRGGRSSVDVVTDRGRTRVHSGRPAYAFAAANDEGLLVALVGRGAGVEVAFVPIQDGRPRPAEPRALPRSGGADQAPVGAAIAARPDGFAVFWQEASTSNPNRPYSTYLARVSETGRPRGQATPVPAPWPLADVIWLADESRYYFLLYYGGQQATRLCGVHVDGQTLRPVEHPWWASPSGAIDEARLGRRGARVVAVYRDGETLRESDVTSGGWAREPARPRDHGRIAPTASFLVGNAPDGALRVGSRPLP